MVTQPTLLVLRSCNPLRHVYVLQKGNFSISKKKKKSIFVFNRTERFKEKNTPLIFHRHLRYPRTSYPSQS